jgi:hypothetical protein
MVISLSYIPEEVVVGTTISVRSVDSKMILKFISKLTSGKTQDSGQATNAEAINYKGYTIVPTPKQNGGQWTTEGQISKEIDGVTKSQYFIRVDTHTARDEAANYSILKAKRIIDEKGDKLFKDK